MYAVEYVFMTQHEGWQSLYSSMETWAACFSLAILNPTSIPHLLRDLWDNLRPNHHRALHSLDQSFARTHQSRERKCSLESRTGYKILSDDSESYGIFELRLY